MSGKSRFVLVIILLLTDVVKHLTVEAKGAVSLRDGPLKCEKASQKGKTNQKHPRPKRSRAFAV